MNAEPGFTVESFRALKLKRIKIGTDLICSLVFDEMAIRRQKLWHNGTNFSFVNFGQIKDEIASQALVFMVISLDESWKIPVGYFFVNSMKTELKANLMEKLLIECHNAGVK